MRPFDANHKAKGSTMNRFLGIGALMLCAAGALGQSINVDLNMTSGTGSGAPGVIYAGAAGQAGSWNSITSASSATASLVGLNGAAIAATLNWDKSKAITGISDAGVTGDNARLMLDGQFMTGFGTLTYTFAHMTAGTYAVYTYAGTPGSTARAGVTVTGTGSDYQYVGGNLGDDLVPGISEGIHVVTVAADGSIVLKVSDSPYGNASCSGIQIRKIDSGRIRFLVSKSQTANPETGLTWSSAFSDLQPILTQAAMIGGFSCEIWVRSGFYYPTTGSDRSATFTIPDGLRMYGGFTGSENSLNDRASPVVVVSGLSGGIGGSSQGDNSYTVVTMSNCSQTTVMDGFYIYSANNTNSGKGGGMRVVGGNGPHVRDLHFSTNWADLDGGAVYINDSGPWFSGCSFYKSDCSNGDGGAVYASTGSYPEFYNCQFLGNTCIGAGAGLHLNFSGAYVEGCMFSGNHAEFGNGGAVHVAGNAGNDVYLVNCSISSNVSDTWCGGVDANNSSKIYLYNSIVWGNTDPNSGSVLKGNVSPSASGYTHSYTTIGGLAGVDGHNPQFVNAKGSDGIAGNFDDNLNLQDDSPCIDAASASNVGFDFGDLDADGNLFEPTPLDLNRRPRFVDDWQVVDSGSGAAPQIDRGCFEFQFVPCPADFDHSGFVDTDDYSAFVAAFEAGTDNADFDGSGFVDTDDFTAFVMAFESGC